MQRTYTFTKNNQNIQDFLDMYIRFTYEKKAISNNRHTLIQMFFIYRHSVRSKFMVKFSFFIFFQTISLLVGYLVFLLEVFLREVL
jgi:hypothetical protein